MITPEHCAVQIRRKRPHVVCRRRGSIGLGGARKKPKSSGQPLVSNERFASMMNNIFGFEVQITEIDASGRKHVIQKGDPRVYGKKRKKE